MSTESHKCATIFQPLTRMLSNLGKITNSILQKKKNKKTKNKNKKQNKVKYAKLYPSGIKSSFRIFSIINVDD